MTAQAMQEIDVVRQVRSFLLRGGLAGERVVDLYTDAHPTLRADPSLRPFQRFALLLDGLTVHPDLVGRLSDGSTTFAVEAKGARDLLRGLAPAACYRLGFHHVFLASAGLPPPDLRLLAREQHIGLLAAYPDQVQLLALPPPHLPLQRHAVAIQQQFVATSALQTSFSFNLPTHYLSVAHALRDGQALPVDALETRLRALSGAAAGRGSVPRGAARCAEVGAAGRARRPGHAHARRHGRRPAPARPARAQRHPPPTRAARRADHAGARASRRRRGAALAAGGRSAGYAHH